MPTLKLTRSQVAVLAYALNSCRLSTFSSKQQEYLPDLGRALAEFLADNGVEEAKRRPGKPKRVTPFADNLERVNRTGIFAVLREE